jgi:hypothetical protein
MDRYPTTAPVTCDVCNWLYNVTKGEPATCPGCERAARMAELNRVLKVNSDLKGKTP